MVLIPHGSHGHYGRRTWIVIGSRTWDSVRFERGDGLTSRCWSYLHAPSRGCRCSLRTLPDVWLASPVHGDVCWRCRATARREEGGKGPELARSQSGLLGASPAVVASLWNTPSDWRLTIQIGHPRLSPWDAACLAAVRLRHERRSTSRASSSRAIVLRSGAASPCAIAAAARCDTPLLRSSSR